MKYRYIENEYNKDQKFIVAELEGNIFTTFPTDENNPEYIAFLENIDEYEKVVE